jgi:hypothetical protein
LNFQRIVLQWQNATERRRIYEDFPFHFVIFALAVPLTASADSQKPIEELTYSDLCLGKTAMLPQDTCNKIVVDLVGIWLKETLSHIDPQKTIDDAARREKIINRIFRARKE